MRLFPILLAAAFASALAAGCASAAPFNPDNLPAADAAGVNVVCRSIMGLEPGQAQSLGCFQALSRSLVQMHAAQGLDAARASCAARNLRPSTGDFAVCVVQHGEDGERPAASLASIQTITVPGGHRSWFSTSNADRRRREALACAAIGFDPAGSAFDGCVTSLSATLFELDNPPS